MKIRPRHLSSALLGVILALTGSFYSSAQAQTIDWSSVAWQAGALNQNVAVGGNSALFAFTYSGTTSPFIPVTGAGGTATPAVGSNATNTTYADGGTGGSALQMFVDFAANTQSVTLIVTFQTPVPLVRFSLFDVDAGTATNNPILVGLGGSYTSYTFQDQISNISASSDGTTYNIAPTITRSTNNTGTGTTAYGIGTAANNLNTANVGVDFTNPIGLIKSFQFTYTNHVDSSNANGTTTTQNDPAQQLVALGNIQVPEPGTVASVVAGGALLGVSVLRRRRVQS